MTSLAIYAHRGRQLTWLYFAQKWFREITDGKLTFQDATSSLYLGAATLSLLIPDPLSTALGWTATGIGTRTSAGFARASAWWGGLSMITRGGLTYIAFLPLLIAWNQNTKALTQTEDWDAALGESMTMAQAVPNTERLQVPQSANPMAGIGRIY